MSPLMTIAEGGSVVKNIVVSIQNVLLAESVILALKKTGNFRLERVLQDRISDTEKICESVHAELLLMEVTRTKDTTLEKRLLICKNVKRKISDCKIALLCDENADPELADQVKQAKQLRQIDAFFYESVTSDYLTAALDAL